MKVRNQNFHQIDIAITKWMAANALLFLYLSIGLVFFWFGMLKYFEGLSPAEDIAINTIHLITSGLVPSKLSCLDWSLWRF